MQTPDITKAQIVAFLQPIISVAIAFGAPISDAQQVAILGLAGTLSTALLVADAVIRHGRSKLAATQATIDYQAYAEDLQARELELMKRELQSEIRDLGAKAPGVADYRAEEDIVIVEDPSQS